MPPVKTAPIDDADITLTSATQTEDEVRASLEERQGEEKAGEKSAVATGDQSASGKADDADAAEAESERPDREVSEAARRMRANRLDERKARLREEISLATDSIQRLGGTVPTVEKKAYPNPQAEFDALTRQRHEVHKALNEALKKPRPAERREPERQPVVERQPAAAAAATTAPEFKKFDFPIWDDYQAKNPEADYTAYLDARDEARDAWKTEKFGFEHRQREQQDAVEANRRAEADAIKTHGDALAPFKQTHPDFDEVTDKIVLDDIAASKPLLFNSIRKGILREGVNGPALQYFLGTHPEYVDRLKSTNGPSDFLEVWGEMKGEFKTFLKTASAAAPAASAAADSAAAEAVETAAPRRASKPAPAAPAPLEAVAGSAAQTRTLHSIAEDSEDADEYIERRTAELRGRR